VGTPGPGAKLDVAGHISLGSVSVNAPELQFRGSAVHAKIIMDEISATDGQLWFQTQDAGTLATRMTILDNGNVGIGTTNPQAKLGVNGNVTIGTGSYTYNGTNLNSLNINATNYPLLSFYASGSQTGKIIGYDSASEGLSLDANTSRNISFKSGGSTLVRILSNGYVGIGTTSPSRKLFVYGDAGGTSAWYNDSDRGLKKDIREIDNGLDQVLKLRGVYFTWNDTETRGEGRQVGMIAQEVKEIVPEVVQKKGDYYSIATANLVPLLVEAIKEQQKEIDTLKVKQASMEQQQALISALYEKVNMLENQMKLQGTVAQVDY